MAGSASAKQQVLNDSIEDNQWCRAWALIHKKIYKPGTMLMRDDGTYTTGEDDTNEYLLKKYLSRHDIELDMQEVRRVRNDICKGEAVEIINNLKKKSSTCSNSADGTQGRCTTDTLKVMCSSWRERRQLGVTS